MIVYQSDLNCFLCRVCDLRTGGENFLQDNLSNFLNIFPSVKTQEKRKYIYVNNTFCVWIKVTKSWYIFFLLTIFFQDIFFHHCETFSQTCESKFLSFLVRLIFGSVFVLLSSLKLTLFQSKFPLQKCSPFQSVSQLKNIFCLW